MYGNFFSRIAAAMVHLLARNNSAASDTEKYSVGAGAVVLCAVGCPRAGHV